MARRLRARVLPAMAAAKAPLEFHAKRPWAGQEAVDDPDEEDEDDSGKAENGFSLEEVLRLGGTKVTVRGFQGRETGAGVRSSAADSDPSCRVCSVRFPRFFPLLFAR